jgi:hypothetical protein
MTRKKRPARAPTGIREGACGPQAMKLVVLAEDHGWLMKVKSRALAD